MRLAILGLLGCAAAFGQGSGLKDFLMLTPAQIAQVVQLNAALDQAVNAKRQRSYTIQTELSAEYAKPSPDPTALGQRYQELDAISHDISALQAGAQAGVTALLTNAQKARVAQISNATAQQSLISDARCAHLTPTDDRFFPTFAFSNYALIASGGTATFNSFLLPSYTIGVLSSCSSSFPISIRNFLALTDTQVAAIQGSIAANNAVYSRKQARTSDVQVEIRDETAKTSPDPLALGVRYVELNEISQEENLNDQQSVTAARALLNSAQSATLQALLEASTLNQYLPAAESCRFFSPPPGVSGQDFTGSSCRNYF